MLKRREREVGFTVVCVRPRTRDAVRRLAKRLGMKQYEVLAALVAAEMVAQKLERGTQ